MGELSKDLTVEMFEEGGMYKKIAEAIGPENFVKLAEVIGGATVYIPKPESLTRPVRDARIREQFNGYNHLELAREYGVSVRWIYQLCGEGYTQGQLDIFEYLGAISETKDAAENKMS